jgi:hypothetical protein
MYATCANQGLPPDNVELIAREIFKAVRGSAPVPAAAAPPTPAPAAPSAASVAAKLSAVTLSDEVIKKAGAAKSKYPSMSLVTAANKKDEEAVLALLAAGYKDLEEKDGNAWTALLNAAYRGMDSSVKALLLAGADKEAKNNVSSSACHASYAPLVADDPSHGLSMETRPLWLLPSMVMMDVSGCWWRQGLTGASRTLMGTRPSTMPPAMVIRPSRPSLGVDWQWSFHLI